MMIMMMIKDQHGWISHLDQAGRVSRRPSGMRGSGGSMLLMAVIAKTKNKFVSIGLLLAFAMSSKDELGVQGDMNGWILLR